jgi:uncharacterized membrane protein YqaE (UPF0057 family)
MMTMLCLTLAYFLPSIVAHHKRHFGAIFILNLLTGWTIVGWIIAMVWALTDEPQLVPIYVASQQPGGGGSRLCANCGKYSLRDAAYCSICGCRLR